ncbi:AraC family transcriptional regulator [Cohnella hongkongensis]|uniref:AraC family transcriptional regulator n=1 Tax=Cohnella hongkongensis TaxID=178337 RepID=A0ABV9FIE3_9BACL
MPGYREEASHDWTGDSIRTIATPSAFAKASLYYVQESGKFRTMPSYYTERENLDSYLVLYTTKGLGYLTYEGKSYALSPGQLICIDCRSYQHYRTDPEQLWEMIWVHFNGSSSPAYYDRFSAAGGPVLRLSDGSRIPAILQDIVSLGQRRTMRSELEGSRLIVDLLTELLLAVHRRDASAAPAIPALVRDVMKHYDRHYGERLTLDGVSALFAADKYHLSKAFKRYTGFSPNEYLIHTRVTRAKELLRFTDMPVAEIASAVGIDSASHFINLFRDRELQTPLAYRKMWRES